MVEDGAETEQRNSEKCIRKTAFSLAQNFGCGEIDHGSACRDRMIGIG